jgi:predicted nuclease of restriction endonuclease-like (RecB) superfamily
LIRDPDATAAPSIESSFDFVLRQVLVRDDRSDYWFVDNLTSGRARVGEAIDQKAASKLLGQLYNDHRPISTVRETRRQPNRRYNQEVFDVIADTNRQLGAKTNITEGVFEQWLQQNMQTLGEIPDGHFVATADISSDVLAVQGCQPVASIRYIIGTLR